VKRTTDWIPNRLRAREGVIQRGVIRGLRFNGGNSATGFLLGTHDPNIQRALSLLIRPGLVVYDIGANVGFTALIAAHLTGPKGRVICFEPQPKCDAMIQHNADINGFGHIQVRREALAGEDGTARFLVTQDSTFSRLEGTGKPETSARHVDVTVRRLDALIAQESLPAPDVMKIDIEGAEAPMLEGAMATLREAKPVLLIELHGTNKVVADALAKAGYTTRVLGSREDILDVHWNSLVIGVPPGRPDLDGVLDQLTQSDANA
jgi:FkbM family methyltransferase